MPLAHCIGCAVSRHEPNIAVPTAELLPRRRARAAGRSEEKPDYPRYVPTELPVSPAVTSSVEDIRPLHLPWKI
jgi:hypothetical protein